MYLWVFRMNKQFFANALTTNVLVIEDAFQNNPELMTFFLPDDHEGCGHRFQMKPACGGCRIFQAVLPFWWRYRS